MILVFWDCHFPCLRLGNPPCLEASQTAAHFRSHTLFGQAERPAVFRYPPINRTL
jgi:hypothetical protein